jgi:serine/threonine protein kinase
MLFNNKYECKKIIGKGGNSIVYKVLNITNKEFYALRFFSDYKDSNELYEKEIVALKNIKNKNIIELKDNFYDEINKGYCIVMELCDGNLRDILIKYKPNGLPLNIIKKIFIQLNDALKSMMIDIGLIHRNLKPENILIKYTDNNRTNFDIKLSSFKFSEFITEEIKEYDYVGTENYMAPEVENRYYNNKCDLWSLGVILYELYTNKYIFYSNNAEETRINRYKGIIKNETDNEMINKLIRKLIQVDIKKRIEWEEYFKDDFFKN